MRSMCLGLVIVASVSGCAPMQRAQIQEQGVTADAEAATCEQRFKTGVFKTHVEVANCAGDVYARGISAGLYPYPDVRLAWGAARLRIAEQLDRHEISETEAKARWMEASAVATAEAQRRNAQNAQSNAAIRANNAAAMAAYGNMISTGIGMMQGR
jgi:hypothetical protein